MSSVPFSHLLIQRNLVFAILKTVAINANSNLTANSKLLAVNKSHELCSILTAIDTTQLK